MNHLSWHLKLHKFFYVEDRKKDWYVALKTKARDVFDVGTGPQCDDDDAYTYCENIPYNISVNDARDNLGWAWDNVEGMTIDASVIGDKAVHEWDNLNEDEFIDDKSNDEDHEEYEYNDDE